MLRETQLKTNNQLMCVTYKVVHRAKSPLVPTFPTDWQYQVSMVPVYPLASQMTSDDYTAAANHSLCGICSCVCDFMWWTMSYAITTFRDSRHFKEKSHWGDVASSRYVAKLDGLMNITMCLSVCFECICVVHGNVIIPNNGLLFAHPKWYSSD
jgi:hypothetical protein